MKRNICVSAIVVCLMIFSSLLKAQLSCYHFVIDAGHGGSDPGSTCYNGVDESLLTLNMTFALRDNLLLKGATVALTRATDVYVALSDRKDFINNENPDASICLHLNAYNGVVQGTETYWCAGTPSQSLANDVQPLLVATMGYTDRGVKNTCYTVLTTNSSIPNILTESLFHDEPNGCTYINIPANQAAIAAAHANGIINYLPACNNVANDECTSAQVLQSSTTCNYVSGTLAGASANTLAKPSCDAFGSPAREDVFYYFFATQTEHDIVVHPTGTGADAVDAVIALYSGANCTSLTEVACTGGTGGSGGVTKTLNLTGLTPGQKYWVRIYDYGTIDPLYPGFEICLTEDVQTFFESTEAKSAIRVFPNPVADFLSIESANNINGIFVKNLLGQYVYEDKESDGKKLVDMRRFKPGIYFLEVQAGAYILKTKVVKQ